MWGELPGSGNNQCRSYRDLALVADAVLVLGSVVDIRDTFIGFQKHLYARQAAM